ncbi:MAG: polysaccharide deacetylase family protein [Nitrospirae bacterium]|nr:polysaccharide deacetylase family protein [Nitrospirota bacterium]
MKRYFIVAWLLVFIVSCVGIGTRETAAPIGSTPLDHLSEGSMAGDRANKSNLTSGLTGSIPLVTFVFDDGNDTDYLVARDIFAEQGAVACSAITTDWINGPGYMTVAQIIGLKDAGWEIMAHTATHPNLRSLSSAQVEGELSRSKATLEGLGLNIKNLVYPYNKNNEMVRAVARRYYRSGRGGRNAVNGAIVDPYDLKSYSIKHDLAGMERFIDRAYAGRSWIIFYQHRVDIKVAVEERHGSFIPGEKLMFSPSGAQGRYEPPAWYLFFGSLYFVPLSGRPGAGDTIIGESSGASARIDRILYDEWAQIRDMIRYVRTRYPDMRIVTIDQGLDILGIAQQAPLAAEIPAQPAYSAR